ncbi:MAG: hypothetical protein H6807_05950 [Planctomycetes bacterium]|nr:hypothetical protein [Planctomycetota bacterium]
MVTRTLIMIVALLLPLLGGCRDEGAPTKAPTTKSGDGVRPAPETTGQAPVLKLAVFADGRFKVNGEAATLPALKTALEVAKEARGEVWYYRQAGETEPPPIALELLTLVAGSGLPLRLSNRPDYSDVSAPVRPSSVR